MKARLFASAAALLVTSCFLAPHSAKADSFLFTISSPTVNGSGKLVTAPDASIAGAQDIQNISGTLNGVAIEGTVPSDFTPTTITFADTFYYTFDNLLHPNDPSDPFDQNGLGFETVDGVQYNIGTDPMRGLLYEAFNGVIQFDQQTYQGASVNFTLTQASVTPEPSSIALMGTGLLLTATLLRRRIVKS